MRGPQRRRTVLLGGPDPARLIGALGVALVVATLALSLYLSRERQASEIARLAEVLAVKARGLELWLGQQRSALHRIQGSSDLREQVARLVAGRSARDAETVADALARLHEGLGELSVILYDTQGRPLAAAGDLAMATPALSEAAAAAARTGTIVAHLLQREDRLDGLIEGMPILVDSLVPIRSADHPDLVVAVLAIRRSATGFLYPAIEVLPQDSVSAETLLVRSDGDGVHFVSRLREHPGEALRLRLPLSDAPPLLARALGGERGFGASVDQRGVEVLAVWQPIAGTDWAMVVKVDASEALAPVRIITKLTLGVVLAFTATAVLGVALSWRQQQRLVAAREKSASLEREALGKHLDLLSRYANDAIFLADDECRIVQANERAIERYGYAREELIGMHVERLLPPEMRAALAVLREQLGRTGSVIYETTHCTRSGGRLPVEVSARVIAIDGREHVQEVVRDVSERKLAEKRLMHLAHHDALTGLPNRVLLSDRLEQALAQAKRNHWMVGVMFIDVDRFKYVNDTFGHAAGDLLLRQVSDRLLGSVRSDDTVARLGGDEFAIVLLNPSGSQGANSVARKILAGFDAPFLLDGNETYVTASIGIALYPDDGTDPDTLIRNADAAMYRAKENGRNASQFYAPEITARVRAIHRTENDLRRALERNEFFLCYQPKASVADGSIAGVEALLRWRHPERGLVAPGEFIPVLEETGLIVPVGEWVLHAACMQVSRWNRAGTRTVPVAVNLSARQFAAKDLEATVGRILAEHRVDPTLLELEITETSLMTNIERARRTLDCLKGIGVRLSIDDFGTGYSSLAYLKRFPLDALKIDRSFVRDIASDADDAAITRAVISMAHSLGLRVVAEAVETAEQLTFLARYGCDEIQGYYFSRPLEAGECGLWLREGRRMQRPRAAAANSRSLAGAQPPEDLAARRQREP